MHPATKRSWLQTGGLPVEPIHADLRAEFDQVHDVAYIGGGCFRLRDPEGRQIGLVQFQGQPQARLDATVMATTERLATGETKPVDIAAGDTLIRPLDMRDPADRLLAEKAISKAHANVIVPDDQRQDPPPIDLPDFEGERPRSIEEAENGPSFLGISQRGFVWFAIAILLLAFWALTAHAFGTI